MRDPFLYSYMECEMSQTLDVGDKDDHSSPERKHWPSTNGALTVLTRYGSAVAFVAIATIFSFAMRNVMTAPSMALIYVIPVVIAATSFGWGPALLAAVVGVASFDFLFVEPIYSLRIATPSDIGSTALLLVIAAIVSAVAGQARKKTDDAKRAAHHAQALQALAHCVLAGASQAKMTRQAAETLGQIFDAPVVILTYRDGGFVTRGAYGQVALTPADRTAAAGSFASHLKTRSETYPYDQSTFDFWPAPDSSGERFVIGVDFSRNGRERPFDAEWQIELVAGYLAMGLRGQPPTSYARRRPGEDYADVVV